MKFRSELMPIIVRRRFLLRDDIYYLVPISLAGSFNDGEKYLTSTLSSLIIFASYFFPYKEII